MPSITDIALPPANMGGTIFTVIQVVLAVMNYKTERTNPTQYSKFSDSKSKDEEETKSKKIGSQLGMLIIYGPATIVSALFAFVDYFPSSLAANLVFLHFLKRTSEVLGLHKYSGEVETSISCMIGTVYVIYASVVSSLAVPLGKTNAAWTNIGYVLFAIGMFGNFYHHYLLTLLRKEGTGDNKRYTPPVGGLFRFVASPHYLFETIIWLGISCVAQQTNAFLVFLAICTYLTARAQNTNDFYFNTFTPEEWPRSRKAIIPFLL